MVLNFEGKSNTKLEFFFLKVSPGIMLDFKGKPNSKAGFEIPSKSGLRFYKKSCKIRVKTRAFEIKLGSLVSKERKFGSKPKSSKEKLGQFRFLSRNSNIQRESWKVRVGARISKENWEVQILKERKLELKLKSLKGSRKSLSQGSNLKRKTRKFRS